jgi:ABC-type transport system substrate-binding protein
MLVHRSRRARSLTLALCLLTVTASAAVAITPDQRPASAATSSYDPNGVLRHAYDLSGAGAPVFDPVQAPVPDSANALGQLLYDSLLHKQPNGSLVPALATSATITDPQTIKVVLRPGLQFQDGTKEISASWWLTWSELCSCQPVSAIAAQNTTNNPRQTRPSLLFRSQPPEPPIRWKSSMGSDLEKRGPRCKQLANTTASHDRLRAQTR